MKINNRRILLSTLLIGAWGFSLWTANFSLWPIVILTAGLLVFVLAQYVGVLRSIPISFLLLLGSYSILIQFSARLFFELNQSVFALLTVVYFGLIAWLFFLPQYVTKFVNLKQYSALIAVISVLMLSWVFMMASIFSPTTPAVSWGMREDSVWNMISSRIIILDSGIDSSVHPHSSPLTAALFAAAMAFGRGEIGHEDLLLHDVQSSAAMWITWVMLGGIFSAMIVWNKIAKLNTVAAFLVMVFVVFIPLSWFVTGMSFQQGFSNVSLSISLLFAIWLVWSQRKKYEVLDFVGLIFGAIALLSAWGPLAMMPLALIAYWVYLALKRREFYLFSLSQKIWVIALLGTLFSFGLIVSVPNLLREGKYLSADGGMFYFNPLLAVAVIFLAVFLSWRYSRSVASFVEFQGICLSAFTTGAVILFLVYKRRDLDELWGYYPAKMAWVFSAFLIILIVSYAFNEISKTAKATWVKIAFSGLISAGTLGLMLSFNTPGSLAPSSALPLYGVLAHEGASNADSYVRETSRLASPENKYFVYEYVSPEIDRLMNLWLLQLQSKDGSDPIRVHAYTFGEGMLYSACDIDELWGQGTYLITSNSINVNEINTLCGFGGPKVIVRLPS